MLNNSNIVKTIRDCQETCEHMIHHIKMHYDTDERMLQLALLSDCADICNTTANYISRRSPYSKNMAYNCAMICEACGKECAKYPDEESQYCARVCLNCAMECREFAM